MTNTIDLINAIEAGRSLKIQSIFEELINNRLVESINQKRAEIADFVFNGPKEERVDEQLFIYMPRYGISELLEFTMSEEFAELDEETKNEFGAAVKQIA